MKVQVSEFVFFFPFKTVILEWVYDFIYFAMVLQGQTYAATGYLTVRADSEERFMLEAYHML